MKKLLTISLLILIICALPTVHGDVVLDGLVAQWQFEENTLDSSGNGHTATLVNSPRYDIGVLGKCISLGGGSYVNCHGGKNEGDPLTWADLTGPMTMCMWFKAPDQSYANRNAFITKGISSGYSIEQNDEWESRFTRTTYFLDSGRKKVEGSKEVIDGIWRHVASVYDGSTVTLYVDGQIDNQISASGSITTNNFDLAIGENLETLESGSSRAISGDIDDVRLYNRALSQSEIQQIVADVYRKAYNPTPLDGSHALETSITFQWEKGGTFSKSYNIYLGTDFNDVSDATAEAPLGTFLTNCTTIIYDHEGLEEGKTYYWRVDGISESGYICKGDIWEFSTTGNSMAGWWKLDGDMTDSSGNARDGSLKLTSPSSSYNYVEGPFGGQAFESLNGAYIEIDDSGDASWSQFEYGSMTIAMWMKSNDPYYHTTLISKGSNAYQLRQSSTTSYGYLKAYANGPVGSGPYTSVNCFDNQWHHVAMVLDRIENKFKVYVDGQLNNYSSTDSDPMVTNSEPLIIGACPAAASSIYFRGAIDDVRVYDYPLNETEISALANPVAASFPEPANGAVAVSCDAVLSWQAGGLALSHDVYLGTDASMVESADKSDAEYVGNFDPNSYSPATRLEASTTYYWRVDEVYSSETVKGLVWQFDTRKGGDFDGDGVVGYVDLGMIADQWLADVNVVADGNGDGKCNMVDYAIWAKNRSGKSYYVDSVSGSDNNDGRSPSSPWKSISKVNGHTFEPGDRLLFKAGSQYANQQMMVKGSGSLGAPIVMDMYGEGDMPRFDGNGVVSQAIYLYNVEYWEVNNLEITNTGATRAANRRGIYCLIYNYGLARHIRFNNLYVHDVNGSLVKAEGGGWGIKVSSHGGNTPRSRYDDVRVENCHVVRCDRNGIGVTAGYGSRYNWYPGTNVVVRNNLLEDIGGDVILMIACDGAVIEYNVIDGGRTRCEDWAAGIWPTGCDNTLIQFNEVSGMVGTNDAEAFDSDNNCRNTIFQYNYTHDNQGGFMLICCSPDEFSIGNVDTTVRYNISENDGDFDLVEGDGAFSIYKDAVNVQIYNNVFYVGPHLDIRAMRFTHGGCTGSSDFYNNIWYVDGRVTWLFEDFTNYYFSNNVFYGNCVDPPTNYNGLTSDPMLVNPGSGGYGLDSVDGYMLDGSSPCLGSGVRIRNNGGRDYWGNDAGGRSTDIGAHQRTQD